MLENRNTIRKETALLSGLAFALCFLLALFTVVPLPDIARYGNIAQSFADGDWAHVLHPRVSPLMPLLAGGIVWVTGLDSFLTLKLVSSLFFALTIFPLCGIFRHIFPWVTARLALFMALAASVPMRYGASGLRDSAKGFFFILCVWLLIEIFRNRGQWKYYVLLGCSASLLALTRTECAVYSALFVLTALLFEFQRFRLPWKGIVSALAALAIMTPWLGYMMYTTGYPVPEIRYVPLIRKMLNIPAPSAAPAPKVKSNAVAPKVKPNGAAPKVKLPPPPEKDMTVQFLQKNPVSISQNDQFERTFRNFLIDLYEGFYPGFGIIALLGIILRMKRKEWTREETILLSALVLHAVLLEVQILISDRSWYISRRYLLPIASLEFGWSAWFAMYVWNLAKSKLPKICIQQVAVFIVCGCIIGLYVHAWQRIIKSYSSKSKSVERKALMQISGHIRNDYKGAKTFQMENLPLHAFRSNRLPIVVSSWEQLGYLSGGQTLSGNAKLLQSGKRRPDYIVLKQGNQDVNLLLKDGYRLNKTFRIRKESFELYSQRDALENVIKR